VSAFSSTVCLLLNVLHLIKTWENSVGEGEGWVRGGRSTFTLVKQNIVQALCTYAEAVKQQIICAKHWKILMAV